MVVTGAAGGVGSVATAVLGKLGYHVIASTGRAAEADYLKQSGRDRGHRPRRTVGAGPAAGQGALGGRRRSVGSTTLANLLSMTNYGGAIAACGLAGGMDLPSSVAPFILRGVCLLGIDSVMCPIESAARAWQRLAERPRSGKLVEITQRNSLERVIGMRGKNSRRPGPRQNRGKNPLTGSEFTNQPAPMLPWLVW